MKESYQKGVAPHLSRELCLDVPVRAWGSVSSGKHRRGASGSPHSSIEFQEPSVEENGTAAGSD